MKEAKKKFFAWNGKKIEFIYTESSTRDFNIVWISYIRFRALHFQCLFIYSSISFDSTNKCILSHISILLWLLLPPILTNMKSNNKEIFNNTVIPLVDFVSWTFFSPSYVIFIVHFIRRINIHKFCEKLHIVFDYHQCIVITGLFIMFYIHKWYIYYGLMCTTTTFRFEWKLYMKETGRQTEKKRCYYCYVFVFWALYTDAKMYSQDYLNDKNAVRSLHKITYFPNIF